MTEEELIRNAIEEDCGDGDHTSLSTIPQGTRGKMKLLVKEKGILAGVRIALMVFRQTDPELQVEVLIRDGSRISPGDVVFTVEGNVHSMLKAERLVLNFMQRMSGIATQTRQYADAVEGTGAQILDTRKTTPNMRSFEKEAVMIGGGNNHRFGLYDMILVKDNHVDFAGGIDASIRRVRAYLDTLGKDLRIEIEVRNLEELKQVLQTGQVHRIMLDNFSPMLLREAVKMIGGRFETEASGGITLKNIREVAECGVDYISVGALTHQIHSLDLSLKAVQ